MTGCEYAGCIRPGRDLDGYCICSWHVRAHLELMAEDRARTATPYSGQLRPSRSLAAVLAVLEPQEAVA